MKEEIYDEIKKIGEKYDCDKIVLFGSRARGDNREKSDIICTNPQTDKGEANQCSRI